jgi:hypothetical protein
MYCLEVGPSDGPNVMAIQTVKDEQYKFSNIDCTTRAEAVQKSEYHNTILVSMFKDIQEAPMIQGKKDLLMHYISVKPITEAAMWCSNLAQSNRYQLIE